MKLAILLLCHTNPKQVKMFVDAMKHPDITIFVHVDKKCTEDFSEVGCDHVYILPDEMRCDVRWAQISQVDASLNLLKYAEKTDKFDFFWLCSGQDFPIKSNAYILDYLNHHLTKNFIHFVESYNNKLGYENNYDKRNQILFYNWMTDRRKFIRITKRLYIELTGGYKKTFKLFLRKNSLHLKFYFGSQWWCLNRDTVVWILDYLEEHPEYYRYYTRCLCPDESYFHTLVMNSPYADSCSDYLHYIDWSLGKHSPKILGISDMNELMSSSMLMARKFNIDHDPEIIKQLLIHTNRKKD